MRIKIIVAILLVLPFFISCDEQGKATASPATQEKIRKDITGSGALDDSFAGAYGFQITDTESYGLTMLTTKKVDTASKYTLSIVADKSTKGKYSISIANLSSAEDILKLDIKHSDTVVKETTNVQEKVQYFDVGKDVVALTELTVFKDKKPDAVTKTIINFSVTSTGTSVSIALYSKKDGKEDRKVVATGTKN